jgi:hypothetical protein
MTTPITAANVRDVVETIYLAHDSRLQDDFASWCNERIGCPVSGTKAQMLKQAVDFAKRLAVTDTQCQF